MDEWINNPTMTPEAYHRHWGIVGHDEEANTSWNEAHMGVLEDYR